MTDFAALAAITAQVEEENAQEQTRRDAHLKEERIAARKANDRLSDDLTDVLRLAMRLRDRAPRNGIYVAHLPEAADEYDHEPLGVGHDLAQALADLPERAQAIVDVLTAALATFQRDRAYLEGREADNYGGPLEARTHLEG